MSPGRSARTAPGSACRSSSPRRRSDGKCVAGRLLAAGRQRHGPVDREPGVVVLRRHREQLERRVLRRGSSSRSSRARCRRRSPAPGSCGRSCRTRGSAPTSDGPKSDTMTSIFLYLAMSADRTFWVSAGSQFVTSNGCSPMNVYLWVGSRILCRPWFSSTPWLLPFGPLSIRTLPPFGSTAGSTCPSSRPPARTACRRTRCSPRRACRRG